MQQEDTSEVTSREGALGEEVAARAAALDAREERIDSREERVEIREAFLADRTDREKDLLADADKRDDRANARDAAASQRDMSTSLDRFLTSETLDPEVLAARTAAASDRTNARGDRAAAKADRSQLTDDESSPPPE